MKDWSSLDRSLLTEFEPVVAELSEIVAPDQILLVGARCRDLWSWAFGCDVRTSTNDTDVAVALQDWYQFAKVQQRFRSTGNTGHRFLIGGNPTDIVPFGDIEAPPGTSSRHPGKQALNVHGFSDVYERADALPLSQGVHIRIPTPEGYAILKSHAWLDRSVRNEHKDAEDLALAVHWYAEDLDRVYAEGNTWAMDLHDFDLRLAAAALLGRSMGSSLGAEELAVLTTRICSADRELLAHYLAVGTPGWPRKDQDRLLIVNAMFDQLVANRVQ